MLGGLLGANLWVPLGMLLGGLWFFAAPVLTGPALMFLLLVRGSIDSWAEEAQISSGGFTLNPVGIANLFLLGTVLALVVRRLPSGRFFWSPTLSALLIFAAYLAVTTLWSPYPEQSIREVVRFAALVAAFTISANLARDHPDWARRFVLVMSISILFPAYVAMVQFVTGTGLVDTTGVNRVYGTAWNPNGLGIYCMFNNLLVFPLMTGAWRERRPVVLLYALIFVLSAVVGFLTYTRAVWLALPVGWILCAWYSTRRVSQRLAKTAWLLLFGALVIAAIWPIAYARFMDEWEVISTLTPEQRMDPHFATAVLMRFYLWSIALDLFRAHPWLGNGWGMFSPYLPKVSRIPPTWDPHNDYLLLLAETGVVGLFLFLVVVAATFRRFVLNIRHSEGLALRLNVAAAASLAAYMFTAFTNNLFQYTGATLYFWTLAGLAQGLVPPRPRRSKSAPRRISDHG